MKRLLLGVLFIVVSGCEIAQVIQEGPKPQTTEEALMFAYGQMYVLKNSLAVAYVGENPEDLAIGGLIINKIGAIYMQEVVNSLDSVRAGTTTVGAEILRYSKPVPEFDALPDTANVKKVKDFFVDYEQALGTVSAAIGTITDVSQCKITLSPTISVPCTSSADYLYIMLLKYKKLKDAGVVS